MGYRKFKAEGIFDGYQLMDADQVLITDTGGAVVELVDKLDVGGDIEEFRGILCPGFVNSHCHLELSHMKGLIPERTGLVDFLLTIVNKRHFEEGTILQAIVDAEEEMWRNGISGVGDICNNALTVSIKKNARLRYHNFIETSGFTPGIALDRFEGAKKILDIFQSGFNLQESTLVPHAPYSVSPELFELINDMPGNGLLTIHNQESTAEDLFFEKGEGELLRLYRDLNIDISFFRPGGKKSLQNWLPCFNRNQSMILVHNVTTTAEDLRFSQPATLHPQPQTSLCLCPNANLYISGRLPDVPEFVKGKCHLVIGTDSLASNHQLSILEEIKTLHRHFPDIALSTILQWATINGARALQMEGELGSFEKGKRPGVVVIEGWDGGHLSMGVNARRVM